MFSTKTIGEIYEYSSCSDNIGFFDETQLAMDLERCLFWVSQGDSLFTCDGVEVGRFSGAEVYDADGSYLGEPADRKQEPLYCGYEDFPSPEILRNNFLQRRSMTRSFTNADHVH